MVASPARKALWVAVAAATGLCLLACQLAGFTLAPSSSTMLLTGLATIAIALRIDPMAFGRLTPLVIAADAILLFIIVGAIGAVGSYIVMRYSGALTDQFLADADRLLGFDWGAVRTAADQRPKLMALLICCYSACFLMPLLIVTLLPLTGHAARLYRYLATHSLALLLTIVTADFFPARAAFSYYRYRIVPDNAVEYGRIIAGLRDGSLTQIDLHGLGGIITFPSFHATMAILFAWAVWPIRIFRLPIVAINALMWIAAVPIGGHYIVDLFGGSIVAIVAILLTAPGQAWGRVGFGRAVARGQNISFAPTRTIRGSTVRLWMPSTPSAGSPGRREA